MTKDVSEQLNKEIMKIPEENMLKFFFDLQTLIEKAQGEDYENFNVA